MPIPAELCQPADDRSRHDEPDEISAGRSEDLGDARVASGEYADPESTDRQIEQQCERPTSEAERSADDEDAEGLAGERHRFHRDHDLGRERDDQSAGDDQRDMPDARRGALGDGDREPGSQRG